MITKYELRECKHLKMEISELREQISELVSMMTAPRISRLTGMPGSGHGEHDDIVDAIAKADKLRSLYDSKIDALVELQLRVEQAIENLSAEDQMLLRMYYYSNLTWEQVAARMGYAWAQIHREHKVILERLASETSGKDDIE